MSVQSGSPSFPPYYSPEDCGAGSLVPHPTKTGFTKKDVSSFLVELMTLAYKEAKNPFTIPGIGKLVLVNRKARLGRNPKTGETIQIPAKKAVKFRVAKACKDAILGK